jgi:hypothetical protein
MSRTAITAVRELSCREIVELVTDYLEEAMEPALRTAFEVHLEGCVGCTHYLRQVDAAIRISGSIEPEALSPQLRAGLVEVFRDFDPGRL